MYFLLRKGLNQHQVDKVFHFLEMYQIVLEANKIGVKNSELYNFVLLQNINK